MRSASPRPVGVATISVTPTGVTPNLDASITLYDGTGAVVGLGPLPMPAAPTTWG